MSRKHFAAACLMLAVPGVAVAADHQCQIGTLANLPVMMSGLRAILRTKINGHDALFAADSGAWFSMISPGSAAEYELVLEPAPPGFSLRGVGGSITPHLTTVKTFTIANVPLPRVQFLVGGSEFGSVGLLGQNFLGMEDAEFDLAHGMIRLTRTLGCSAKDNLAYWISPGATYSELETESDRPKPRHIVASIFINGVRVRALFDTGAPTSFITRSAAARFGLKPDGPGVTAAGRSNGIGRHFVDTWIGPVQSVKIGDEEIRNTRIRFGGDMEDVDMLIGADFFLSHHIYWSDKFHKLYFTFNGGHVFDLRYLRGGDEAAPQADTAQTADAKADATPTDAEGYSRRGGARASRGDLKGALADFDEAIKAAPDNVDYLRQRAQLRLRMGQPLRAVDDLEHILKLNPEDVDAHLLRAEMRHRLDRDADIGSDLDAAAAAAPRSSDRRLAIATGYQEAGEYSKAIAQYDLWIAAHPDDVRKPIALNGRCWARALGNISLDLALKDCNAALSAMAHNPSFLDSRAMVRLRMGDYPHALADYDESVKGGAKSAWTFYGRGIVKLRLGRKGEGEADIAKAKSVDADIVEEAKKRGTAP